MKTFTFKLPLLFSTALATTAMAEQTSSNPHTLNVEQRDSRLQIGGNYTYAHVKPKGNTSTHGSLGGAQALYEFRPLERIYGGVALAWRGGKTTGHSGSRSISDWNLQERIGYTFGFKEEQRRLSLFSGFGYRHFGEKVHQNGNSVRFDYNELYIPVGFLFDDRISSTFCVGLNFQWMPQIYPTVKIDSLKGARWIIKNKLNNFFIEVPFTFHIAKKQHLALIVSPFAELWHDGRSTAKDQNGTSLGVPANTYVFAGVNVNFAYDF